jgi:hypothetical protein
MKIFEIGMLVCFGISWPISMIKSIRTKLVIGKSPLFMAIVILGYIFGFTHKCINHFDWVSWLYALNGILVAVDLMLYYKYLPQNKQSIHPET